MIYDGPLLQRPLLFHYNPYIHYGVSLDLGRGRQLEGRTDYKKTRGRQTGREGNWDDWNLGFWIFYSTLYDFEAVFGIPQGILILRLRRYSISPAWIFPVPRTAAFLRFFDSILSSTSYRFTKSYFCLRTGGQTEQQTSQSSSDGLCGSTPHFHSPLDIATALQLDTDKPTATIPFLPLPMEQLGRRQTSDHKTAESDGWDGK